VYLPAVDEDSAAPSTPPPPHGVNAQGGTFLVVDDEEAVRRVVRRILEATGHRVHECVSGADAVERIAELKPTPEVAILDLLMPVMDGPATARGLRELLPGLGLVATSGFSEAEVHERFGSVGGVRTLQKPFTAAELIAAAEEALADVRRAQPLTAPET